MGFPSQGISSNLDQDKREEVLGKFRAKTNTHFSGNKCYEPGY